MEVESDVPTRRADGGSQERSPQVGALTIGPHTETDGDALQWTWWRMSRPSSRS